MKLIKNPEYGLYEKDNQIFCDSLQVANELTKRHSHVLRDIENKMNDISKSNEPKFGEINFLKDTYKDDRNRKQAKYLMTKDGFSFLVTSYSGIKATNFKIDYIKRFNQMEQFIQSLQTAKLEFSEFTNAIMNAHEEPKHYHFSNEINMINKIVLGLNAKQFKEENNIDKSINSIRPYLTQEQIKAIETLQRFDIGLVTMEPDYNKRKEILTDYFMRLNQRKKIIA